MTATELFAALAVSNDHWRTGRVSRVIRRNDRKRRSFYPWAGMVQDLPFRVIVGPRQVGKTTTIGHLMQHLLDEGVDARNVLYAPLDQPAIAAQLAGLDDLVEVIERFLVRGSLSDQDGPVYVFLDELQVLEQWPLELKSLYDRYHPWLRVVATGSSAAALRNESRREGVGRWVVDQLFPLKFNEVMEALDPERFSPQGEPWLAAHRARKIVERYPEEDHKSISKALDEAFAALEPHRKEIQAGWDRYLIHGGYPAAILAEDVDAAYVFLQSTVDAAITTDLKLFKNLRKPNEFRAFLANLASNHGGKFNAANYAREMGLQKETPARWKAISEELYLVRQLGALSPKGRVQERRPDKAYIQDPGIRAFLASANDLADLEERGTIGFLVEGVIHDHVMRLQFMATGGTGRWPIGYADPPEIDFLVAIGDAWLAMECKYKHAPSDREIAVFKDRVGNLQLDKPVLPIVITRSTYQVQDEVLILPAWMFAYLI